LTLTSPCQFDGDVGDPEDHVVNLGLAAGEEASALARALKAHAARLGLWHPRAYAKGAGLFSQGETVAEVLVLDRGLVKLVYGTADGEEWIKSFIVDRGVFGAADGAAPGSYGATALEPSIVARLSRAVVEDLVAADAELRAAYLAFSAWVVRRKQAREEALLCLSAEARYLALMQESAPVLARLPQGDIARYLGITPVAFSRIKRRLAEGQSGGISPSARRA
jgi:CRP-like cAMP-binding protein